MKYYELHLNWGGDNGCSVVYATTLKNDDAIIKEAEGSGCFDDTDGGASDVDDVTEITKEQYDKW